MWGGVLGGGCFWRAGVAGMGVDRLYSPNPNPPTRRTGARLGITAFVRGEGGVASRRRGVACFREGGAGPLS